MPYLKQKLFILTILATIAVFSQAAHAKTTLTYKVFAGGINAVAATLSIEETPDTYKLFFESHTRGFLKKLAPWSGSFESYGWSSPLTDTNDTIYQPEKHTSISVWREEKEVKEYFYAQDGSFKELKITEDSTDKSPKNIDTALTNQTIDLLAATMMVMNQAKHSKKCEGTSEVFDGKRRFKLIFTPQGTQTLVANKYNIYAGDALQCSVEIEPLTGKWHKKPRGWLSIQEQGRQKGALPMVWFGQVEKDGLYVPVKVRVKTNYGTLFMHLKNIKISNSLPS